MILYTILSADADCKIRIYTLLYIGTDVDMFKSTTDKRREKNKIETAKGNLVEYQIQEILFFPFFRYLIFFSHSN